MERYRIREDGSLYFLTFAVVDWLPVFVSDAACRIITESLTFCHKKKDLRINAYVIMPTHLHAVLFSADSRGTTLKSCLTEMRKFTGHQLCDYCARHMPACFSQVFREKSGPERERRFWQERTHPEVIETESFWKTKVDYLHDNPCRKGFVTRPEHWRFSSAAYWQSDGRGESEVPLSAIDW